MIKSAVISEDGLYRYSLSRIWDESKPMVMFIMLNPSTADAKTDDPTIKRCIGFAKSWGYGGLYVGNLFAYRATNPKDLLSVVDPIGKENIKYLKELFSKSEICVHAWGNSKIINRLERIYPSDFSVDVNKYYYIALTKDLQPKHPLYLKSDLKPKSYITFKEIF
jgi:hypothetical protein